MVVYDSWNFELCYHVLGRGMAHHALLSREKSKIWKMNVFNNLYWAVAGSQDDGDFGECAANG